MRSAIVKATCEKIVTAAVAAIALSAASTVWAGEPAATLRLATYNIHQGMLPVVVVPDKPTEVEKFAAKELSGELGKCLGETPKIIGESAARGLAALPCGDSPEDGRACRPATTARLYVGATQAAKAARADGTGCRPYQVDEVFLKSVNDGVVLDGDPARAVIYAVDLYLEKYCGVRWWTDDASHHPTLKEVPAEGIDLRYAPQFKYRETYYRTGLDPLFKVRSKGNFTSLTRCIHLLPEVKFIPPEMGGNHRLYFFEGRRSAYHSFFEILPPKVYFDKHPEWYSLIKGKREAKQLCLANEEMKAEYIRETMRRLREDPAVDFIQVSQNDGYGGWCECEKCKALMDEDGGVVSGPYLRFANAVAEAVEREFPKVRIDTFAYVFTTDPPAKTRPRDNMVVRFCVYKCDISRRLDDETSPRNLAFRRNLEAWSRIAGGRLFIWNYLADFHAGMLPHPNISQIAPDVRLFAANGAVGVFQQGDPLCVAGTFANLRHYIAAHLLWNPSEDERRLMDEFLYGYYGQDAAPHLKRFIAFLDASARKEGQPVKMNHEGMEFLTVDEQLALAAIMDDAVEAAERDGEPFAARVRRERLSVDNYVLMNYDALRDLAVRKGMKWTRPQSRAEAVENWIREVKSFGVVAVRETMDADNIDKYFEKLRRGDANPTVP